MEREHRGGEKPEDMNQDDDAERARAARPRKEPKVEEARLRQQAIGVRLRHMFEQVVNEPVPDEFLDILRKADGKGPGGGRS